MDEHITKKKIYDRMQHMLSTITEKKIDFEECNQEYHIGLTEFQNIGFTLNNKLTEMQRIFSNAHVKLFHEDEIEDALDASPVSEALILDIMYYLTQATLLMAQILDEIHEELSTEGLSPINKKIKTTRRKLRVYSTQSIFSKKFIDSVNSKIRKFNKLDDELYAYSLEDNLLDTLRWHIDTYIYDPDIDILSWIDETCSAPLLRLGQDNTLRNLKHVYKSRQELDPIDQENIGITYSRVELLKRRKECIFMVYYAIEKVENMTAKTIYQRRLNKILSSDYKEEEYPIMITELEELYFDIEECLELEALKNTIIKNFQDEYNMTIK